ncbi:MAG: bifunctional (p)ppGpp synthetase/guanosine-3',5'-bis(diphosphate) 3'-pyrophosphohydrolase [Gammaproteobacteria bacterium]|nr:bifunctional (p)ppGpp synthetase/guanosine-3',5'-bis(diphosphate) 3'-pyrophosphohydrolase [Gammaproteobacteria bacterium]
MNDLIERARLFATSAHKRIDQRRKYSNQPYQVHLQAVAELVASISDDPEMIAAAWLHDTVEDTPATLDDISENFGIAVAYLVENLTDVSKPSDGNRALRKTIDRDHLARASARAMTVKLADLIDNCSDITRHDERFARVYLQEMGALLEVLGDGDQRLYNQARRLHVKSLEKLGLGESTPGESEEWDSSKILLHGFDDNTFRRMFTEIFTAGDIAEGMLSFDIDTAGEKVLHELESQNRDVASVRVNGSVQGYVRASDIDERTCAAFLRQFNDEQVVSGGAALSDVIHVLTRHDYCFVTTLGHVGGVICRDDVNKPMVRMWLFGMVTMIEMGLIRLVAELYPDGTWQEKLSKGRLQKARDIQNERQRRNVHSDLMNCLQLSDKAQILIDDPVAMERLGMGSKKIAKRAIHDLESLRNHLAHAQDIVQHDWPQIARMSVRMEETARG